MEYLKGWLKSVLYINVLLLICESFVKKTKYEKYLGFFSGFLLMLCLLKPLLDLTGASPYMDSSYLRSALKNEIQSIGNGKDLEDMKNDIQREYNDALENQIARLGESFYVEVDDVKIGWSQDGDAMETLKIRGQSMGTGGESSQITSFRDALIQFYQLESSNINIEMKE